eukprot:Em0022g302a
MPTRGGTRGGQDQFEWEDVKVDKDRENYLGHSLKAPVGRWQKGKDLTWYTKDSKVTSAKDKIKEEVAALKKAEEEAMAAALGLKKPQTTGKMVQNLTRQEIAEVCKRRDGVETDPLEEERVKGVGYQSQRAAALHTGTSAGTKLNDGVTVFEHDPSTLRDSGKLTLVKAESKAKYSKSFWGECHCCCYIFPLKREE